MHEFKNGKDFLQTDEVSLKKPCFVELMSLVVKFYMK